MNAENWVVLLSLSRASKSRPQLITDIYEGLGLGKNTLKYVPWSRVIYLYERAGVDKIDYSVSLKHLMNKGYIKSHKAYRGGIKTPIYKITKNGKEKLLYLHDKTSLLRMREPLFDKMMLSIEQHIDHENQKVPR